MQQLSSQQHLLLGRTAHCLDSTRGLLCPPDPQQFVFLRCSCSRGIHNVGYSTVKTASTDTVYSSGVAEARGYTMSATAL